MFNLHREFVYILFLTLNVFPEAHVTDNIFFYISTRLFEFFEDFIRPSLQLKSHMRAFEMKA